MRKSFSLFSKRLAVALGCSLFLAATVQAQDPARGATVGIKGGLNLTNFYDSGEDVDSDNLKLGFQGGLFLKTPITTFFSLQPEILFSNKGNRREYNADLLGFGPGQSEVRFNLNYIEVPVLGVLNLGRSFNFHFGPYAAFLVNANVRNRSENDRFDSFEDLGREDFNTIDYGLAGGIGFDANNLSLGFRYGYGLRDVAPDFNLGPVTVRNAARNSAFQLYVGIGL